MKNMSTSNRVLAILGLFALAFIVAMTVIFCVKGSVPDTLIQYVLGAGGVEATALAAIKAVKVWTGKDQEKEESGYDRFDPRL